jgi:hypothetical protein
LCFVYKRGIKEKKGEIPRRAFAEEGKLRRGESSRRGIFVEGNLR